MLPYEIGKKNIKHYRLREFTEGIKRFYGHESFEITLDNPSNIKEVLNLLEVAYREQEK